MHKNKQIYMNRYFKYPQLLFWNRNKR